MKRDVSIVIVVFFMLVGVAIISYLIFDWDYSGCGDEEIIGGDRDVGGCLVAAGYSFDEEIGACIRSWEIVEEDERIASKIVVDSMGKIGLTIVGVDEVMCEGCFSVSVDDGEGVIEISLNNWSIVDGDIVSIAECSALGGRVVDSLIGLECLEGENEVGCVEGCFGESICCV